MSNAIHSEVIELVLSVEKFERGIEATNADLQTLVVFGDKVRQSLGTITTEMVTGFNAGRDAVAAQRRELEAFNAQLLKVANTQNNIKAFGPLVGADIGSHNANQVSKGKEFALKEAANREAAARAKDYADLKADLARREALYLQDSHNFKQVAMGRAFVAREAANREAAARAKDYADLKADLARREALYLQNLVIQKSMSHKIGSTVAQGNVGAAITASAGGAFMLGANNIGVALYMLQRLSFATSLGSMKLAELAEKFGLLKGGVNASAESVSAFGKLLVTVGGVAAVAATALGTMFAGRKVNAALAEMSTLLADTVIKGAEFATMMNEASASAVKLASSFGNNITDTVKGFTLALSTGINAVELERFGEIALRLGKGLGATFEQSTTILTTFRDAYSGTVEDMAGYSDVLFNAINVGKFNISQLNANIGRVTVTAASAGVSLKDMMSALATLNRVGMSTSQAITSLNQFIVGMVNPSASAAKEMDKLGIAYGATALKGRSLSSVISEIKNKVGGHADLYGKLFSEERARRGIVGLAANPELMRTNREEMEKTGTAAAAAARAMNTFDENMGKLGATISSIIQLIGSDLLNAANAIFFNGPLSSDSLLNTQLTMEQIGVAIKLVGIVIIGVSKLIYDALALAFVPITTINHLLRGEFKEALMAIPNAIASVGLTLGNTIGATFSTLEASAERMLVYTDKARKGLSSTNSETEATKTAVTNLTGAFTELGVANEKSVDKTLSKYDELIKKLKEVADSAKRIKVEAEFEAQYKPGGAPQPDMKGTYARGAMIVKARELRLAEEEARNSTSAVSDARINKKITALREELDSLIDKYLAAIEKAKPEAEAKFKEEQKKKFLEAHGIIAPAEATGGVTSVESAGKTSALLTSVLELMRENEKRSKEARDGIAGKNRMNDVDSIMRERDELMVIQSKAMEAMRAIYADDNLSAEDKAASYSILNNELDKMHDKFVGLTNDLATARTNEAYTAITHANAIYAAKIKIYKAEMQLLTDANTKIDGLLKKYSEQNASVAIKNRPGAARRAYQDQLETGTRELSGMRDPVGQLALAEKLDKVLDRFIDAASAEGLGERGDRRASEFRDAISSVLERTHGENEVAKKSIKGSAEKDRQKSLVDNELYQAVRSEAMNVVSIALTSASAHGISVAGALTAETEVNIGDINLNIDPDRLKKLIKGEISMQLEQLDLADIKGTPRPGAGNHTPPGGGLDE